MKNRKKLIALIMVLALACASMIGGTLAYFTDDEDAVNTFTYGNIDITLEEKGENASGEIVDFNELTEVEKELMPSTGKDDEGNIINAIKKEVYVTNDGDNDAYVRVHIAIPQILDDGAETFDASKNLLHFNYEKDSVGEGKWDWSKAADDDKYEGNWNFYTAEIEGIWYNVYVVTYEGILASGASTVNAMHQVYLEATATQEDMARVKETLGDTWNVVVVAEAAQAQGFKDAYTALNTAFGVPGEYTVEWPQVAPQE